MYKSDYVPKVETSEYKELKEKFFDHKNASELNRVLDALSGFKVYFFGGMVRDILMSHYDKCRDFDLLVENGEHNIASAFCDFEGMGFSRLGGIKWKPDENFEIDIVPFSNFIQKVPKELQTIENIICLSDLDTSAAAYSLEDSRLLSTDTLPAIKNKKLDILNQNTSNAIFMTRIVWHSLKLNFSIGPRALNFIKETYTPIDNLEIKAYLNYKKHEHLFGKIISKLETVTENE